MRELILDLLNLSRVKTASAPLEDVELDEVLDRVLGELGSVEGADGAVITRDRLPKLTVDASRIGQVFHNLIGNALKFRGQEPTRIHISARCSGSEWTFAFRDNGIGIDPDHFERIFSVFQRLHPRGAYPGNGIGLSMCRKIIEQHGGRIWVESEPAAGSTFFFTLPTHHVGGGSPSRSR